MSSEKVSKNKITIEQISTACRHVEELLSVGMTENYAIRILELLTDTYAKLYFGGSATPHHADQVDLWSIEAQKIRNTNASARPKDYFRVEHGTPRRAFARMALQLYQNGDLNEETMGKLVTKYWKLAVITIEEDQQLNAIARSTVFDTPEERWTAAGIKFE